MTTLTELIDEMINERTFSLDGVKAIEQMRQKAEQLEADLKHMERTKEDLANRYAKQTAELSDQKSTIEYWTKRELALRERETKVTALERSAAVAAAESAAFKHALEVVFKPATVRETMFGQAVAGVSPPTQYNQYPTVMTTPVNQTTERSAE